GPVRSAHPASQQPRRAGIVAGSTVAYAAKGISNERSQDGGDSSGQTSPRSSGSCSSLAGSFPGRLGAAIACPEAAAPEGFSSLGARLHELGRCTPCKFLRALRGCRLGLMCKLCHDRTRNSRGLRCGRRVASRPWSAAPWSRRRWPRRRRCPAACPRRARWTASRQRQLLGCSTASTVPLASGSPVSTSEPEAGASSSHGSSEGPSFHCQGLSC
ncbi:unnamed protein product, partial [Prorocentrum cordatum]